MSNEISTPTSDEVLTSRLIPRRRFLERYAGPLLLGSGLTLVANHIRVAVDLNEDFAKEYPDSSYLPSTRGRRGGRVPLDPSAHRRFIGHLNGASLVVALPLLVIGFIGTAVGVEEDENKKSEKVHTNNNQPVEDKASKVVVIDMEPVSAISHQGSVRPSFTGEVGSSPKYQIAETNKPSCFSPHTILKKLRELGRKTS